MKMALYPIFMPDVKPYYTLQKAFEEGFDCFTYDWVNILADKMRPTVVRRPVRRSLRKQLVVTTTKTREEYLNEVKAEFIGILKETRPDYCFMQVQNEANMDVETVREMSKYTKIINWSGDIRRHKEWYDWFIAIGKEIHLSTFSNTTDVDILRKAGCRADYLQVGYDHKRYFPKKKTYQFPPIVFCGNEYGDFDLSPYRIEAVKAMKDHFGEYFGVYGGGWERHGIKTRPIGPDEEAQAYSDATIGISISNFQMDRYHSDRLLRIMGCGSVPMSHDYRDLELDYVPDHDIVVFNNIPELIVKCEYLLANPDVATQIGNNAANTATSKCTWSHRVEELKQLLMKYES